MSLGIEAEVLVDFEFCAMCIFERAQIIFQLTEDMNLYRITGKYRESAIIRFKVE